MQVPKTDILTGSGKENTDVHGANNLRELKYHLCKSGSLPSDNDTHKCSICGISQYLKYQLMMMKFIFVLPISIVMKILKMSG